MPAGTNASTDGNHSVAQAVRAGYQSYMAMAAPGEPTSGLRTTAVAGLVFWLATVAGCTSLPPPTADAAELTPVILLAGAVLGQEAGNEHVTGALPRTPDILTVNPAMVEFLDRFVDRDANAYLKLHQLVYAIIGEGSFRLKYDDRTLSAQDAFRLQAGNCLSFTNMFVAMARNVGLEAQFQEVDIPPDWQLHGDTFVLNRHVNAKVSLGRFGERVVDFNIDDFRATYDRQPVDDRRAFAHFYNNLGVAELQRHRMPAAFRYLRTALEYDEHFAPAWSNLGTLYRRYGHPDQAEASYLLALRENRAEYVAMSNLAQLYQDRGDDRRADFYLNQVDYHRLKNPYYRYALARQAFQARDYPTAITHLQYAVRQKEWEDRFYFLLGLSYLQLGNDRLARRWLSRAEEVAQDEALKRSYRGKLDLLMTQ